MSNLEKLPARMPNNHIKYPFWFGGSATSIATFLTHPLELVKVRLQTRARTNPGTVGSIVAKVVKNEGFLGLYSGISASILRQTTYSTVRFGIYEEAKQRVGQDASFPVLCALAAGSGFAGGITSNWADVLNVRMQNDSSLPVQQRKDYKNAIDGIVRMAKEEGVRSLFRGWITNSSRAAVVTANQLASYDIAKRFMMTRMCMEDTLVTQLCASFVAGLVAATVASPLDVIKTRTMTSGAKQGTIQLLHEITRIEGGWWIFRGWIPSFLRQGPHTMAIFFFLELHRKIYRQLQGFDN